MKVFKKILILTTVSSTFNSFLVNHSKILKNLGFSITYIGNFNVKVNTDYIDSIKNVSFSRFPFSRVNFYVFKEILAFLKIGQFDYVYTHTPIASFLVRLAIMLLKGRKPKVIYFVHGYHFHKHSGLLSWLVYFPLEYILSFFTDYAILINFEDYRISFKMKYKKTFFLNGIGFSENKISTEKRILNDVPMINLCSVGELNHNKNHFFVVKVLKKYNLDFIKYRIAGEGPLKSKLSKYILKHNLHNVELLGRVINMQSFYQECDLLVHPSHREGLAISPLEAMANGIPVIATNIRGLNDYVNNLNGYIIEKNDVLSFVKILKTIHKKPTELIIKGKRSILDSKKYSWNNLEIEISKIFKIIFNQ